MKGSGETAFDFSVLRELRRRAGVTLEQLAEETGLSFSTLNRIESNQNQPSLATLARLAARFGMTPANLLDLAGSDVLEFAEEDLEQLGLGRRRGVRLPDVELVLGEADAGDDSQRSHTHPGFYQVQWVLKGRLAVKVQGQEHVLGPGQAVKFDAAREHASRFLEDTTYLVVLVPRRVR